MDGYTLRTSKLGLPRADCLRPHQMPRTFLLELRLGNQYWIASVELKDGAWALRTIARLTCASWRILLADDSLRLTVPESTFIKILQMS